MKNIEKVAEDLGLKKRLPETQVLAQGFKSVNLEGLSLFVNELQTFGREELLLIKKRWEKKFQENPHLFPGPLASVMIFEIGKHGILQFRLQRSRFDLYDGLRNKVSQTIPLSEKPLDLNFPWPLSMGAVTVTADNFIIFGIRSKNTAFAQGQATTLPSGFYNPDSDRLIMGDPELHKWLMSIRFTIIKELKEEVGIEDFESIKYLGMFHADGGRNPLIAMTLTLAFSKEELQSIIREIPRLEIESYHFIPNRIEEVADFLKRHPPTSHDVAKLIWHFAHQK